MKRTPALIFACAIIATPVAAFEQDKVKHFAVGAAVGAGVTTWAKHKGKKNPWLWGCGASLLVGVAKEAYDRNHGGQVEAADVFATGLGGCGISIPIQGGKLLWKRK